MEKCQLEDKEFYPERGSAEFWKNILIQGLISPAPTNTRD